MKKVFIIFERIPTTEGNFELRKWHSLGKKNSFHTKSEAEIFITDLENYKLFNLECEYIILPVFVKEVIKFSNHLNPVNYA